MRMRLQAARFRPHERDQEAIPWQATVEREVCRAGRLGLNRQQIVERAALLLYRDDLRELGWVLDLGLLTWEMYLEDAELMVDSLLQQVPGFAPDSRKGCEST